MEYTTQRLIITTKIILFLLVLLYCLFGLFFFRSGSPYLRFGKCTDRYIYMYDLPGRFNSDLLKDCLSLCPKYDMCRFVANFGMGPNLTASRNVLPKAGWFATDQFTLEVIFHNRMKQYECLTTNSHIASAIYVPFYAGLDIGRHIWPGYNVSVRDSLSLDLIKWLEARPEWRAHNSRDHFLVSGRVSFDYRRADEDDTSWGNKFMFIPETQNITLLAIESAHYANNEVSIPYPTYFHPSQENQVLSWKKTVLSSERPWLFSFVGARRPNQTDSIRNILIDQCSKSKECEFLDCGRHRKCNSPSRVVRFLKHSKFCLQPGGDSYTRRSTFDSILSGCIPVFFHPCSAYAQYIWYFPKNYTKYSVFISEDEVRQGRVSIEDILLRYSEKQIREMRENVISMIPKIVYKDPRYKIEGFRDAFDVAIDGVLERVKRMKKGLAPFEEERKKSAVSLLPQTLSK